MDHSGQGGSTQDTLYAQALDHIAAFRFDAQVAQVFPDMIRRSVPGYGTIIAMTGVLAGRHAQDGSRLYDLGCSLGASTLAMASHLQGRECRIIAVDNAPAMLEQARASLARLDDAATTRPGGPGIDWVLSDLRDVDITDASVVVLNFTLQFVPVTGREAVLARICAGMRPGGILVLSEKIRFEDPHLEQLNTELHHQFKRDNGYSDLEISQKRSALENVLVPETLADHRQRLTRVGFSRADVWFQCFNFASLVALR